ncbi:MULTISPECIES: DUF3800 domain-containing protein [Bradyrhizobium]|uniref:DUF3800 domain-containing protein n=1 Tax=Bradyrhizobium TaxID=374 RepID=UPI001957CFEE|nr:DUF3800 domain-containing protein [Bradyrhizobium canariense]MBM7485931.1 hypothetical protein [Bradyrhizobium canariense]
MHYLFIDESGELGLHERSSEFFLIAALCTENLKALEKRVWKEKAKLINDGWPKDVEIKGTSIWGSPHNPRIPEKISAKREDIIGEILQSICAGPNKVHYSIAKKKHLSSHIMKAEYGIAYNFLCGTLLCRAYAKHFAGPLEIVVDQRSKETHSKMKFDGYVETRLVGDCCHELDLTISHAESHDVPGLQAVDFLSWALFRRYESGESKFSDLLKNNVGYCDDWYSTKK